MEPNSNLSLLTTELLLRKDQRPALNYKVLKLISLENMMYSCVKLSFLGFGGPSSVSNPPASKPSRHYKGGSLNEE